ncbi:CDGSH iron-sulfur domain-containing protein [Micromonospora sp. NPDC020750]|uniref:CDGSH iron-sulfur domain-containing protein n=1 Tax=unclassified Micromonospora TaxID=2617518 RepID=UPI00378DFE33
MATDDDAPAATITPYQDGPLLVRGDFALVTPEGRTIDARRGTVALCRCGRSALKPFCDGTHKTVRFRAGTDREG